MGVQGKFNETNLKYRLDPKVFRKAPDGARLYQIVALRAFGTVEAGERGGFIEGEHNLSHQGNCWVAGKAMVRQKARLNDDALACDFVDISGSAQLYDQTLACGHADITGDVKMYDESTADEFCRLFGHFEMRDRSHASGRSIGCVRASMRDRTFIHGECMLAGTFCLEGDGELDGGTWTGRAPEKDLNIEAQLAR
jgi:hypothetical protein